MSQSSSSALAPFSSTTMGFATLSDTAILCDVFNYEHFLNILELNADPTLNRPELHDYVIAVRNCGTQDSLAKWSTSPALTNDFKLTRQKWATEFQRLMNVCKLPNLVDRMMADLEVDAPSIGRMGRTIVDAGMNDYEYAIPTITVSLFGMQVRRGFWLDSLPKLFVKHVCRYAWRRQVKAIRTAQSRFGEVEAQVNAAWRGEQSSS
jgi:hypothetical protein